MTDDYTQQIPPDEYPADPETEKAMIAQMEAEQIEEQAAQEEAVVLSIIDQLEARHAMTNIAEDLTDDQIGLISSRVVEDYETDKDSRADWENTNKDVMSIAKLEVQKKTYAGEPVANVKYPIITNAAIQFAARAYPEIIKGEDVVKPKVVGKDPDGAKAARGKRVCDHMSYQLLNEMADWEDGVDQLLFTLPIVGCAFKKTYFSAVDQSNISEMVFADDLVVNYYAQSLEKAPRITHVVELTRNEIVERIRTGVYLDFDVEELGRPGNEDRDDVDDDTPHRFLEQHRWYDLDGDGYQEPYIVTVHYATQRLVRISARYELSGVEENEKGEIIRIEPVQYFTRFLFMPSPDGSFYGMGFGGLLFSINSAANTVLNQLLDAGTLSNRQSGFLGRGVQLGRGGSMKLKAGEWKPVQTTGDDLRKNIVPLPVREPSTVLFQLLGMLIESGKELSGITEVLSGHSPGSNVPAETTLALIEQGLQVYSAIHKRIHRSLYREFQKIRRLNRLYLSNEDYNAVTDEPSDVRQDYNSTDHDIIPVSDPNSTTNMQRIMKAKALLEMKNQGLNDEEINRRYLSALGVEDIESLMPDKQQHNPMQEIEFQKLQTELEKTIAEARKVAAETELVVEKINSEKVDQQAKMDGIGFDQQKLNIEKAKVLSEIKSSKKKNEAEATALTGKMSEFKGKTAETAPQGPYVEKGMVSNNEED